MISDTPNLVSLGYEDDYYEDEQMNIPENFSFEFSDGSRITLIDFEDPVVEVPHKRFKTAWMAEEVRDHISEEQLDNDEAIQYILTNYNGNSNI